MTVLGVRSGILARTHTVVGNVSLSSSTSAILHLAISTKLRNMSKTRPLRDPKKESLERHSAALRVLDKNGDGIVEETEMPWNDSPKRCKWIILLYSFRWLAKFLKSPVVGSAADQASAIKETVNTIGLIAALVLTITVPIAINPQDVEFKINTDLWGSDVQIMDEATTMILYYTFIYMSICFHCVSICGAILAVMTVSCLSDKLLIRYIEEVGSTMILYPACSFLIGTTVFILGCVVLAAYTFGLYITVIFIAFIVVIIGGMLLPLVHVFVKQLYVVPKSALEQIETSHNKMTGVTADNVAVWLEKVVEQIHYTKTIDKKKVADIFRKEGICGMALPSVDEGFLREKCTLTWGDAHLLMREINLRKGHVVHWQESK